MDAQQAASILTTLIRTYDRVSLPGLGSFVSDPQPSRFMDQGRLLTPPLRVVRFSLSETWNDGRFEMMYAQELGNEMQAKQEVVEFMYLIKKQLQILGHFELPGLGLLKRGKKQLNFLKALDCDLNPDGFGLSPLGIKPLAHPSQVVWRSPKRGKSPGTSRKRLPRSVYICLGIVLLIILLAVLLYIFRDELKPLFECMFYTAEERNLFQYIP